MSKSVIVIGGGLGGLFTGAILAKEGYCVSVLEKNHTIGGGLQTFWRKGVEFETGMHALGGLREGGSLYKLCYYLGIINKLKLCNVDKECMDSVHIFSDNITYKMHEGKEGFAKSLSSYFPQERDNIERYVNALYSLAEEFDFFYLRPGGDGVFGHSEHFLQPADEFIAKYLNDERLRIIAAYMNPLYGGVKGHIPAYVHALINVLYIDGASRFVDGSQQMANALKDVIEDNGGKVYAATEVNHIEIEERSILYVESKNGSRFSADHYISAIHPCSLLKLTDDKAFPRSYRKRLDSIPNSYSAFTVYLTLKEGMFPYINHICYCVDDYKDVWTLGDYSSGNWPYGFMYMTPAESGASKYASKIIITSPVEFECVKEWEDTTHSNRGEAYLKWKEEQAGKFIEKLARIYPSLPDIIEDVYTSSPLTIRDYYNIKEGSMYGFRKDSENIILSQVPIYTKIQNLLLTGQNVNLQGICGVPLTAINTAEAILGKDYVLERINKSNNT